GVPHRAQAREGRRALGGVGKDLSDPVRGIRRPEKENRGVSRPNWQVTSAYATPGKTVIGPFGEHFEKSGTQRLEDVQKLIRKISVLLLRGWKVFGMVCSARVQSAARAGGLPSTAHHWGEGYGGASSVRPPLRRRCRCDPLYRCRPPVAA